MTAATAYEILKPLGLAKKERLALADMLKGVDKKRRATEKKSASIAWAKRDFKMRMQSKNN